MSFPRWIDGDPDFNLREVAPGLYVGADLSPVLRPNGKSWDLVIDLYGSSGASSRAALYLGSEVVRWPFEDGTDVPRGVLEIAVRAVPRVLREDGAVLIHCQAGLSRSASEAYALLR